MREMHSKRPKFSKFSRGTCSWTPLEARALRRSLKTPSASFKHLSAYFSNSAIYSISYWNPWLRWHLQTLKKSRFDCSRTAFHLRSRKRYNSENIRLTFTKLKNDWSPLRSDAFVFPVIRKWTPRKKVKKRGKRALNSTRPQGEHTRSRTWTALMIPLPPLHVEC